MTNRVPISAECVKKIMEITGKSHNELGKETGRTGSYYYHILNGDMSTIPLTDVMLLEKMYGVNVQNIMYELEHKPETSVAQKPFEIDNEIEKRLYKLIYSAVFNAVKAAWEDAPVLENAENE